jgi:IS30 family transposase
VSVTGRGGGPRHKLTPEVEEALVASYRAGVPAKFACEAAGVDTSTVYRWLRFGEKADDGPERQLFLALKKARAVGIRSRLKRVTAAAKKGAWQADCWVLERTHPDQFGSDRKELAVLRKELASLAAKLAAAEAARGSTG